MSIVLDALRRGRGPREAQRNGKPAHADAVLHTLGYRQAGPASPLSHVPRVAAVLAAAALILAWGFVKFVRFVGS